MGILLYSQDPGGGNLLSLVAQRLQDLSLKDSLSNLVHPLSEPVFKRRGVRFSSIRMIGNQLPLDSRDWRGYLSLKKITHVICSLSSPYGDLTNGELIRAARHLDLPILGFFDHWVGYDRLDRRNEKMGYAPKYFACVDEVSKNELINLGIHPLCIFPVGHAHLEQIEKLNERKTAGSCLKILLVSQTMTKDKSFFGIFSLKVQGISLLNHVFEGISRVLSNEEYKIRYRPHPKEQVFPHLPKEIELDTSPWSEEIFLENDLFIGINSMLLLEAYLAGCECIRLSIPEIMEIYPYVSVPVFAIKTIEQIDDFGNVFKESIQNTRSKHENFSKPVFSGSLNRTMDLVQRFLSGTLDK